MRKIEDVIDYERKRVKVEKLLKSKGLNLSLTKSIIHPYMTNLEPIHVAQAHGIHLKLVEIYYEKLGQFLESEFELIKNFLLSKEINLLI